MSPFLLQIEPLFQKALFNLALLLANELKRPEDSVPYLERNLQINPSHVKSYLLLGDIAVNHLKNTELAEKVSFDDWVIVAEVTSYWVIAVEVVSDWFVAVEVAFDWFIVVKVTSNWFIAVNVTSDRVIVAEVTSDWFVAVEVASDWFIVVKVTSDWFITVNMTFDWFIIVKVHLIGLVQWK